MTDFPSYRAILDLWSSRDACAADVGCGCTAGQVSKWWQRRRIPGEWWAAVASTKVARTNGVTVETMARIAARPERRVA